MLLTIAFVVRLGIFVADCQNKSFFYQNLFEENNFMTSKGTPDFFSNKLKKREWSRPRNNKIGSQRPRSGQAYYGIIVYWIEGGSCYFPAKPYTSESISLQLPDSLKSGRCYYIELFVSLAEYSDWALDRINVLFSNDYVFIKDGFNDLTKLSYLDTASSISLRDENCSYLDNRKDWIKIFGTYKATGGEKYLKIGTSIANPRKIKIQPSKGLKELCQEKSYYYLEDLRIEEVENCADQRDCELNLSAKNNSAPELFEMGKSIALKNISYEINKSELLPASFSELDDLAKYLSINFKSTIVISGHTDNTGLEPYNQELSTARARAVADYLISKGIEPDRISFKGYGSSKPIANNDTEEGRAQNRRVEILIEEK